MMEINNIQQRFGDYLFKFISSRVTSLEDAQDIYQEVILKILNKSGKLNKSESLKSWLFTIAKNQIIDYHRTRKFSEGINTPQVKSMVSEKETGAYQELENCLHGFIDALPPGYKEIVVLSEIEGKSQKELSEILRMNYVTLRSKVQRGRDKIKKMLFDSCTIELDTTGRFVDCTPKSALPSCVREGSCGCG